MWWGVRNRGNKSEEDFYCKSYTKRGWRAEWQKQPQCIYQGLEKNNNNCCCKTAFLEGWWLQEPLSTRLFYHSLLPPELSHGVVKLNAALQVFCDDFHHSRDSIKLRSKLEWWEKEIARIKLKSGRAGFVVLALLRAVTLYDPAVSLPLCYGPVFIWLNSWNRRVVNLFERCPKGSRAPLLEAFKISLSGGQFVDYHSEFSVWHNADESRSEALTSYLDLAP